MDRNFAAVTIFTLLFAVSAARISLDPTPADSHANLDLHMEVPNDCIQDSNLPLLPKKPSSGSDHLSESSDKDRIRSEFARFHAINRHFFDEPRLPVRSTVNTRPDLNPSGDEIALKKRLKFEHDYRRERYQHQHHLHHRIMDKYNDEDVSIPKKRQFMVPEKVKTRARPETGFLTSIRKFLKHNLE